ncbi:molybdenum hydroxylase accessory protein, YgfJ family [Kribbella flavida DSM 17836]|uniref:Molybdenum hydroxylase accessory protein, YgfJ family n=1 Tax=Kribbella flavida (strain DSM 17836 / JCM 10339 / NBRC 14399) TaxID=479435 RepID=D2PNA7_KRIFD|nr:nucleotidyltransferase family protein [Kribbella flavida]ADB34591.1 molybdenum hydroxylase accessory protein, YgfJ family [Kribbella flavida DSM 17836]
MFVTGLVLAAEGSPRLGVPRQLLAYRGETLLGATLDTARDCGFDQLVVTLGAAADQVRDRVALDGVRVVESPHADTGSSSIVPALDAVDRRTDGLVVLRDDQPGITSAAVWSLVAESAASIGVTRYDDGRGYPCWFRRETFGSLRTLRSDQDLWTLIESGRHPVTDVDAIGNRPPMIGTWDDYQHLLGHYAAGPANPLVPPAAIPTRYRRARSSG